MKAPLLALLLLTAPLYAQQYPVAAACGPTPTDFSVKTVKQPPLPSQPPAGKALIYIMESMPDTGLATKKVNIGLDGKWLGATDTNTYISIAVAPGIHHFCAIYQGNADAMEDGDEALFLHIDAKPGKTYYLHYKGFFIKYSPSVAFFNKVDADEGLYLLTRSSLAVSKIKK